MLKIKSYVKVNSLAEAYELNQKKTARILGGMVWMKMGNRAISTAIDLSGLGLDTILENDDEFIIGCALNTFALGLTGFLSRSIFGASGTKGNPFLPSLRLPGIESIPFLGKILSGNSLFVYLTLLFVLLLWLFLYKTPYGFWLRASGEKPETLRTAGIDPAKLKWLASVLCGVFCALAGAHLSLGQLQGTFAENMSNNRGYIAFACVIFGAANPPKAYLAALMFGFFDAIGLRLQEYLSADLTNLIPYVITVVMMVYVVVRAQQRKKHRARSALAQKGKSA